MSRLTRDGTAEPVSREQILRPVRGQGNVHFPCSADHEQDWQPYPVDPYSAICGDHTYCILKRVLTFLFQRGFTCPSFFVTILWCTILKRKVWLGQHGMRTSHDSLGGYEWSMLLLHLAQSRRVNARMPALSIFQVALKFIADGGLSRQDSTVVFPSIGTTHLGEKAVE